jgi:hypothetical protein
MSVKSVGEREGRSVFLVDLAVDGAEIRVRMTGQELLSLVEDATEALVDRASELAECPFCDEDGCMLAQTLVGGLTELKHDDKEHRT